MWKVPKGKPACWPGPSSPQRSHVTLESLQALQMERDGELPSKEGAGASPGLSGRGTVQITCVPWNLNYASAQSTDFRFAVWSTGWANIFGVRYSWSGNGVACSCIGSSLYLSEGWNKSLKTSFREVRCLGRIFPVSGVNSSFAGEAT